MDLPCTEVQAAWSFDRDPTVDMENQEFEMAANGHDGSLDAKKTKVKVKVHNGKVKQTNVLLERPDVHYHQREVCSR